MKSRHMTKLSAVLCLIVLAGCSDDNSNAATSAQPEGQGEGALDQQLPSGEQDSGQDLALNSSQVTAGQSGGQSGTTGSNRACYCGFENFAVAKLLTPNARGYCAVFELVEKPVGVDDYYGLNVGDQFGGSGRQLCRLGLDLEPNEVFYVQYTPGQRSDNADVNRFTGDVVVSRRGDNGEVLYVDSDGDTYAITDTEGLTANACDVETTLISQGDPPEPPPTIYGEDGEELDFFDAHPDVCEVP